MEVLTKETVKREAGWLYFIDKQGYIARTPMKGRAKGKVRGRVSNFKVNKVPGYLYFVDKHGHIARAKMRHGRHKKKARR
jgi:hypothetical protein